MAAQQAKYLFTKRGIYYFERRVPTAIFALVCLMFCSGLPLSKANAETSPDGKGIICERVECTVSACRFPNGMKGGYFFDQGRVLHRSFTYKNDIVQTITLEPNEYWQTLDAISWENLLGLRYVLNRKTLELVLRFPDGTEREQICSVAKNRSTFEKLWAQQKAEYQSAYNASLAANKI